MDQEKLLKLNGEYLKLYVTTNSALPKLLKNSGAVVIYRDNTNYNYENNDYIDWNNEIEKWDAANPEYVVNSEPSVDPIDISDTLKFTNNSNYIYLGNELIAGGWGFNTEEQKKLAISYLGIIPSQLYRIEHNLNNEISYRGERDEAILNEFSYYVRKETSIADHGLYLPYSYLNSNFFKYDSSLSDTEKRIPVEDITNLLMPAEYADLYLNYFESKFKFAFLKDNSRSTFDFNYFSESDTKNLLEIKDDIIYAPVGCILTECDIKFNYAKNDSSGISKISYDKINSYNDFKNNNKVAIVYANSNRITGLSFVEDSYTIKWNENYGNDTIAFKQKLMYFDPTSIDKQYDVLSNLRYTVGQTTTYKKFPLSTNSNLKSTENAIKEHSVSLSTKSIIPKPLLYYSDVIETSVELINDDLIIENDNINKIDLSNYALMVEDDYINIAFNKTFNTSKPWKQISFAIPSMYGVSNIYLYWGAYTKQKINITGWFKVNRGVKLTINPLASPKNNSKYDWQTIPYDIFYMLHNSPIFSGYIRIRIEFYKTQTRQLYKDYYDPFNLPMDYKNNSSMIINDEFDSVHWINGNSGDFLNILCYGALGPQGEIKPSELLSEYRNKNEELIY